MDQGQLERERENARALLGDEYRGSVKAIVDDFEEAYTTDRPWDLDMDDLYDAVHEVVGDTEWVIYTYRSIQVLTHTDHFDAVDEPGLGSTDGSIVQTVQTAAYYAMVADVLESVEVRRREADTS